MPIAVSYTLRRLAAKCANSYVIKRRSEELLPVQVGAGVSGGAEAAVHAVRRLVNHMPDDHVFVKLDFTNAFNTVRRHLILASTADKISEPYRFVHASLECSPMLTYGNAIIISAEGSQQGDPLSSLEYCDAAPPTLLAKSSRTKFGFVDDTNLEGRSSQVANDVQLIIDSHQHAGLHLNAHKCEIIANNFELIDQYPVLKDFKRTAKKDMTLLGAPVLDGKAVDKRCKQNLRHGTVSGASIVTAGT